MKHILVIDDKKTTRTLVRSVLSTDYKVISVMNGTQAITFLKSNTCDLILLDVKMPEMDGFAYIRTGSRYFDKMV